MDLCSLDDAFGSLSIVSGKQKEETPNSGCLNNSAVIESRRQDRKKAKRCRGPPLNYIQSDMSMSQDPDRPSMQKMEPVPILNKTTGIREHAPADQDWGTSEAFTDSQLNAIVRNNKANRPKTKVPSYFGASPTDGTKPTEGFQVQSAPFVNTIGNGNEFMMNNDFTKDVQSWRNGEIEDSQSPDAQFGMLSPELNSLTTPKLPPPEQNLNWKTAGISGGQEQFYKSIASQQEDISRKMNPVPCQENVEQQQKNQELLRRMDAIMARLDDMQYVSQESAQKEVLLFIMTGLGVLFMMDLACRTTARLM
jgi:hypothetical protein